MDYELVLKNGLVVLEDKVEQTDIGISEGIIQAIGRGLFGQKTIDAGEKYVIPGGIDQHVHLEMPYGKMTTSDDWETGTRAAAVGGTTTLIDFIDPEKSKSLMEKVAERKALAENRAVIDYGMHMALISGVPSFLDEIPDVVAAGIPSFKMYSTYAHKMTDVEMIQAMSVIAEAGGIPMVHCESDAIVEHLRGKLVAEGRLGPQYHPASRPADAEGEAVERVIALAHHAGAFVYIVHVSTAMGVEAIQRAHNRGQAVWGETCPQYLVLTDAEYKRAGFEPAKYLCQPPLRTQPDIDRLFQGLEERTLLTIGSDHCPFFYHGQKDIGKDVFTKIPGGIPGVEARLMLTYTYGVGTGKMDLNRWVQVTSTNAARIFGMYPQKGCIREGSDADLVIFDPHRSGVITKSMLHENVDYTPYEGVAYQGAAVMTIARGDIIARDGSFVGHGHKGQFIARKPIKPEV
ncbi:MAG: dihydropyrimidinase [Anaerolineaceae bacterium]